MPPPHLLSIDTIDSTDRKNTQVVNMKLVKYRNHYQEVGLPIFKCHVNLARKEVKVSEMYR